MRLSRALPAAALLLAALLVPPAAAQTVAGTVVEEGSSVPVQSAVVVLVDSMGVRHDGALTDAGGGYVLRARGPGSFRVYVERVGTQRVSSAVLRLQAGETVEQRMEASTRRVMLDAVVATGTERGCTVRPTGGEGVARAWDEARKALLSTQLAAGGELEFSARLVLRRVEPNGITVSRADTMVVSGRRAQPFVSAPLASLASHGWVQAEGDSLVFHGPDAATVLADEFLDAHCFSLRQGTGEQEGMIGLEFAPLRGQRLADVRGVLWLDTRTARLRWLDYAYTNLPYHGDVESLGGRVEFDQLATGTWVVRRWAIRMPLLQVGEPGRRRPNSIDRRQWVVGFAERAGELIAVRGTR